VKKFNNRTKNASRSSVTSFPTRRFFSTGWAEIKILYFHRETSRAWSDGAESMIVEVQRAFP
jgi:hypothetical protein